MDKTHDFRSIFCGRCGHRIDFPVSCGKRFCGVCAKSKLTRMRRRMSFVINSIPRVSGENLKFLTLTLKSGEDPEKLVKHLIASFRRLRQRQFWSQRVSGGCYSIELTHSEAGWHVHLHAILMAHYMAQWQLSSLWKAVSGSFVVDIRRTYNNEAVAYLCKYLTCDKVPIELQDVVSQSLKGYRLWSPFGTAHDINRTYKPSAMKCPSCESSVWIPETAMRADNHFHKLL